MTDEPNGAETDETRLSGAFARQEAFQSKMTGPGVPRFTNGRAWHYTNAEGLIGILESEHLWASAPQVLNDSSEVLYGVGVIRRTLEAMLEEGEIPAEMQDYLTFVVGESWVEDMQSSVFIASASREPDLLSQWRNYANADGFAVGFWMRGRWGSRTTLVEGVPTVVTPVLPGWYEVSYDPEEQADLARNALLSAARFAPATAQGDWMTRPDEWRRLARHTRLLLSTGPLTMKHPAFEDEREVRYIGGATDQETYFRASGGRVIPYTRVGTLTRPLDRQIHEEPGPFPVFEIVCGPGCRAGTENVITRLLSKSSIRDVTVRTSQAPFVS